VDNFGAPYEAISERRQHVCVHCGETYIAVRSDQRFCSDYCRLRHWRSRKTVQPTTPSGRAQRIETLLAEIDRLQRQTAELQRANAALRESLKRVEVRLQSLQNGYRRWR
jgi:hypothetical protein